MLIFTNLKIEINITVIYKDTLLYVCLFVCLMVFNATFNNISVILWRSVLLVEETAGPRENHRSVASHWQTLPRSVAHLALIEIRTHNICTWELYIYNIHDCTLIDRKYVIYLYELKTRVEKWDFGSDNA
jgi:hypothetical protein